jgi:hypothetical protein
MTCMFITTSLEHGPATGIAAARRPWASVPARANDATSAG